MAVFEIESNGLIENTVIYYNGQQIIGVKEIFLNLDEDGTFDSIIKYLGKDGNIQTKNIFSDYLNELQTSEPSLTEEEARFLKPLTIESDGSIESTVVAIDDFEQDGIINLFVHIVAPDVKEKSGFNPFRKKEEDFNPNLVKFVAEVTYRNEDDSQSTEKVF